MLYSILARFPPFVPLPPPLLPVLFPREDLCGVVKLIVMLYRFPCRGAPVERALPAFDVLSETTLLSLVS